MFSLQTIFGKGDKFYGLLEAAADAAVQSSRALKSLVRDHGAAATLTEFKIARQKEKEISDTISRELVNTFVTALDRAHGRVDILVLDFWGDDQPARTIVLRNQLTPVG